MRTSKSKVVDVPAEDPQEPMPFTNGMADFRERQRELDFERESVTDELNAIKDGDNSHRMFPLILIALALSWVGMVCVNLKWPELLVSS